MQAQVVTPELQEEAKTYFIKNNKTYKYIGPSGEYQKWYYILHKEHKNKNSKNWRIDNLEYDKLRSKIKGSEYRFLDKLFALRKVSGKETPTCIKCGISDIRVLTINHINGDGAMERKKTNRISRIYRDIKSEREVSDLEVRCYNCNILYEYERGSRSIPNNYKELL
jgi:hypothetical protein